MKPLTFGFLLNFHRTKEALLKSQIYILKSKRSCDEGKMKEKKPSHFKIKSLKTLKTFVLVWGVLRMSPNLSVSKLYSKQSCFDLIAYTDVDYAGCKVERKSTSGNYRFLGGCLVSWYSKKQSCVSLSAAEVEYIVAGCCSAQYFSKIGLKDFLHKNSLDIRTTKLDNFDKNQTSDLTF
ncbi:hypothetical protein M9H77_18371 [Catharanthus roseus]|uniref:Uncharacterized protein n=1 Tax=Catharanthus roseus TaxID=4058 RepID=A0ACC0B7B1_CATRO|nr:hypothetical protein M9H77_18371 [Catharanthus roseus]